MSKRKKGIISRRKEIIIIFKNCERIIYGLAVANLFVYMEKSFHIQNFSETGGFLYVVLEITQIIFLLRIGIMNLFSKSIEVKKGVFHISSLRLVLVGVIVPVSSLLIYMSHRVVEQVERKKLFLGICDSLYASIIIIGFIIINNISKKYYCL